jgi:hypothetical protein
MSDPGAPLDIGPFVNTVARLREGLDRYLLVIAPSPDIYGQMPFQDLIRTGNEQGLLRGDWPVWRRHRDMRARTSHTYVAAIAAQVAAGIPEFLAEADYLRDQLQQRLR